MARERLPAACLLRSCFRGLACGTCLAHIFPRYRRQHCLKSLCPWLQGMRVRPDGPQLISEMIRKELGLDCRWGSAGQRGEGLCAGLRVSHKSNVLFFVLFCHQQQ